MNYRFVKVTSFYRDFIKRYYNLNPGVGKLNYDDQMAHLMSKAYSWADFYSKHLRELGNEAYEIVANALIDYRAGMHAHAARQNGGTHHPAREKTAAGDDTVDGLPAAVGVVKSELGRRIGIAGAAQRPLRVV